MAHVTLLDFPVVDFVPDSDAQLVGGDAAAAWVEHNGASALAFDDTDEEAATSQRHIMPGNYAGGTLKVTLRLYSASDNTNDIAFDVFVEAVTPNADTLDMETATSWAAANSGTMSLAGTTAGDPLALTITLTNDDGVVVSDWIRLGVRRDTDSADDDAVGDIFFAGLELWEDT